MSPQGRSPETGKAMTDTDFVRAWATNADDATDVGHDRCRRYPAIFPLPQVRHAPLSQRINHSTRSLASCTSPRDGKSVVQGRTARISALTLPSGNQQLVRGTEEQ